MYLFDNIDILMLLTFSKNICQFKQSVQRTLLHWDMGKQREDISRVRLEENGGIYIIT